MKRVKLLAAGDDPPDVFAGNQGYGIDGELVKAKLIVPLDQYADTFGWTDAFGEGTLQQFRWTEDGKQFGEGNIYGVGSAGEAVGLFYNSKKLADARLRRPAARRWPSSTRCSPRRRRPARSRSSAATRRPGRACTSGAACRGSSSTRRPCATCILGKEGATYDTPENLQAAQKLAEWAEERVLQQGHQRQAQRDGQRRVRRRARASSTSRAPGRPRAFSENPDIHFANLPGRRQRQARADRVAERAVPRQLEVGASRRRGRVRRLHRQPRRRARR